jgi:hypothetical protein
LTIWSFEHSNFDIVSDFEFDATTQDEDIFTFLPAKNAIAMALPGSSSGESNRYTQD